MKQLILYNHLWDIPFITDIDNQSGNKAFQSFKIDYIQQFQSLLLYTIEHMKKEPAVPYFPDITTKFYYDAHNPRTSWVKEANEDNVITEDNLFSHIKENEYDRIWVCGFDMMACTRHLYDRLQPITPTEPNIGILLNLTYNSGAFAGKRLLYERFGWWTPTGLKLVQPLQPDTIQSPILYFDNAY